MPVMTIFSCPKPFRGHINTIQRNAIQSWMHLRPCPEIILCGDDEGTAEIAREFRLCHMPDIERNEHGTPLVNSIFKRAQDASKNNLICYINTDIILMSDFLPAVQRVLQEKPHSLVVGRRWDLDMSQDLDFEHDWEQGLRSRLAGQAILHAHTGIDYFVFPGGLWTDIPPFALGRGYWDNWLIYHAHSQRIPIVDITEAAAVIHQNHDYSHHPQKEAGVWTGEEAQRNMVLAGGYTHAFTVWDAQFKLTRQALRRRITPYQFYRKLVTLSEPYPVLQPLVKLIRFVNAKVRA